MPYFFIECNLTFFFFYGHWVYWTCWDLFSSIILSWLLLSVGMCYSAVRSLGKFSLCYPTFYSFTWGANAQKCYWSMACSCIHMDSISVDFRKHCSRNRIQSVCSELRSGVDRLKQTCLLLRFSLWSSSSYLVTWLLYLSLHPFTWDLKSAKEDTNVGGACGAGELLKVPVGSC